MVVLAGCRGGASSSKTASADEVYRVSTGDDPAVVRAIGRPDADSDDRHFSSLRTALRARRNASSPPDRIVIHGGTYFLERPVRLTGEDSGVTIEAAAGTDPVFIGGRAVDGWEQDGDQFYAADLPDAADAEDVRALVVDGDLRPRSRLPESGYYRHESTFDVNWKSATAGGWVREPTREELTTMTVDPSDLPEEVKTENVELTVYHKWDTSQVRVRSIDRAKHEIRFAGPAGHPPGAFGVKKYVVWNTRAGLTKPGQWYVDRSREKIVYRPRPDEMPSDLRVFVPVTERLLRLRGVRDVRIRGLEFSVTTTPMIAGGFGAGGFPGAVDVDRASNARLENLHIHDVAGQGIRVDDGVDVVLERNRIHDTGACGMVAPGCDIRRNTVHHAGRIYPAAIGIKSGGKGAIITRNHVHHTTYSGIICGGRDHRITRNHIHHVMRKMTDGGAIYSFGGRDILVRGNYVHHLMDPDGDATAAYYLDEQSRNSVVEQNLSVGVKQPVNNHMARDNTIRGNVFVNDGGKLRLNFPRSDGYTFSKNVLVARDNIVFRNAEAIDTWTGNVIHSRTGRRLARALDRYEVIGTEPLNLPDGNATGDPKLTLDAGRVTYPSDSVARMLGIEPLDVSPPTENRKNRPKEGGERP